MNEREELEAYRRMYQAVRREYQSIVEQMDRLKGEGKTKSATYRQLMGRKLTYSNMLELYRIYEIDRDS